MPWQVKLAMTLFVIFNIKMQVLANNPSQDYYNNLMDNIGETSQQSLCDYLTH